MSYTFDPAINFGLGTVLLPYTAAATSIDLTTGDGARFPDPGVLGAYNVTWWNASAYANPSDDPLREIVRVTAKLVDTLTITRAQEGTSASNKNTALATYKISLGFTKKTYDDITTAINAINPSEWVPMETLTFSNSSVTQTTANFPNASTAKGYKILLDVIYDTSGIGAGVTYFGMQTNGDTTSGAASYVAGSRFYDGTSGGLFSTYPVFLLGYANLLLYTKFSGEVLIGARSDLSTTFDHLVPVSSCIGMTKSSGQTGAHGWASTNTDDYIKNISILATFPITGTFKIFQRQ